MGNMTIKEALTEIKTTYNFRKWHSHRVDKTNKLDVQYYDGYINACEEIVYLIRSVKELREIYDLCPKSMTQEYKEKHTIVGGE